VNSPPSFNCEGGFSKKLELPRSFPFERRAISPLRELLSDDASSPRGVAGCIENDQSTPKFPTGQTKGRGSFFILPSIAQQHRFLLRPAAEGV